MFIHPHSVACEMSSRLWTGRGRADNTRGPHSMERGPPGQSGSGWQAGGQVLGRSWALDLRFDFSFVHPAQAMLDLDPDCQSPARSQSPQKPHLVTQQSAAAPLFTDVFCFYPCAQPARQRAVRTPPNSHPARAEPSERAHVERPTRWQTMWARWTTQLDRGQGSPVNWDRPRAVLCPA